MKRTIPFILACLSGLTLLFGTSYGWTQSSSDPHCLVMARGILANGDEFFGHATINVDFSVSPGGKWRHFVPSSSGSSEEVFEGTIENGICIPDDGTFIQLFGVGRYKGRPVEFEFFGHDGTTDSYLLIIRDFYGSVVYSALADLATGDVSAVIPPSGRVR